MIQLRTLFRTVFRSGATGAAGVVAAKAVTLPARMNASMTTVSRTARRISARRQAVRDRSGRATGCGRVGLTPAPPRPRALARRAAGERRHRPEVVAGAGARWASGARPGGRRSTR